MKKATRLLTILLALVLIFGVMAGCGKTDDTTEPTKAPEETKATEEVKATEAPVEEEGPTWSGTISVASYAFGPMDAEKDKVGPVVEEMLAEYGLDVDLEYVYIEYPQYQEILNTRLTGGTAPDIFIAMSLDNMLSLYDQGALATWTKDFFMEKAPNINAYVEGGGINGAQSDFVDLFWDYAMMGDEMITIPKFSPGQNIPYKNVTYRTDWLEALNVTELPLTVDDFVSLMYRFANEDPDGNGKKDTYGMSSSMIRALFGAYGNFNGFIGSTPHWYGQEDGTMICADVMPENKEVLSILAQMRADDVLHPAYITRENEGGYWALSHHFINGQVGVSALAGCGHYQTEEEGGNDGPCIKEYRAVNGEDATITWGPWPAGPEGEFGYMIGNGTGVGENALYNGASVDEEKMGAILQIMDIFAQDDEIARWAHWGEEGVDYEITDNGGVEGFKALWESNEAMNEVGVAAYRSLYGADSPYNTYVQTVGFLNHPSIKFRVELMDNNDQFKSYIANDKYVALPSEGDYKEELKTYRDETWIAIIEGELPVDYYDTYVEEYMARGGQILTDEASDWWANK